MQQSVADGESEIIQQLADLLARADVVPIHMRQQFARTMYDNGISNERTLRNSVLGDTPDVDLISDIGLKPSQKRVLLEFLVTSNQ
jgi:hypothetical protein